MFEIEQLLSSGAGSTSYLKDQKEALRRAQARLTQCDAEAEAAKKETAALTAQINQVHDSQRVRSFVRGVRTWTSAWRPVHSSCVVLC